MNVGILHPGQMGISIAASAKNSGHTVFWASDGRSNESQQRAAEHDLQDAKTVAALCQTCEAILSVCPPAAAESVALEVIAEGYSGLYLDANAISPQRATRIAESMTEAGINFVDGCIIGGPAWQPNSTWLYLSGPDAESAAALFSAGPLETDIIGEDYSKASALKMCFAAYTKGTTAMLCAILAAAEALNVRDDLNRQWSRNGSDFAEQTENRVRRVTDRAWRFVGEMEEMAATFDGVDLPGDFHNGAAEIYRRIADFKNAPETPPLEDVLAALLRGNS
jgi:3-hydroxyisobutyrate dehydrogenase-like beta-hydroxyacid dehydrogenase